MCCTTKLVKGYFKQELQDDVTKKIKQNMPTDEQTYINHNILMAR